MTFIVPVIKILDRIILSQYKNSLQKLPIKYPFSRLHFALGALPHFHCHGRGWTKSSDVERLPPGNGRVPLGVTWRDFGWNCLGGNILFQCRGLFKFCFQIITGFITKWATSLSVVQPLTCLLFPYLAYLCAEV